MAEEGPLGEAGPGGDAGDGGLVEAVLEVELEGPPLSVKGKKPRALLALLILRRNEPVPTEVLIENLWGDRAPATAS